MGTLASMLRMPFREIVALSIFWPIGAGMIWYGLYRLRRLIDFHRDSIRIIAKQLPDNVKPLPRGFVSMNPSIYQRQASFHCPFRREKRVVTESVTSSGQSLWTEGLTIPVRVSKTPPHQAIVATFRNMYLVPAVCLLFGAGFAVVIPAAILVTYL